MVTKIFDAAIDEFLMEATSRKDMTGLISNIIPQVAENYVKIKMMPNETTVHHWRSELLAHLSKIPGKLDFKNKIPTPSDYMNYASGTKGVGFDGDYIQSHIDAINGNQNYKKLNKEPIDPNSTSLDFQNFLLRTFTHFSNHKKNISHDDVY